MVKEKNKQVEFNELIKSRGLFKAEVLYESLRFAEYDITSGIGEILDNSVEAKASKIYININTEKLVINKGKKKSVEVIKEVVIADNGKGMDYETLSKSLVLGESCRPIINGKRGIGRFGVGLTLGGISLSRRIEAYTRTNANDEFDYTYIDLDEIKTGELVGVPNPIKKNPQFEKLEGSSGTVIKLMNCDRLRSDSIKGDTINASEQIMGLNTFIGRTYRKFISAGIDIFMNGEKVYLHDPLFMDGPTRFDSKESIDLKADFKGEEVIELEIPNSNGKKAEVKIRMSLLPKQWRENQGDGGSEFAKKRKIDMNEGISILRADREVLYDRVEYMIGKKGTAKYEARDRFWGCEISFPPELDDYFHVRYIKRGAEPIPALRDKIRSIIAPVIVELRKEIESNWSKNKAEEIKEIGIFETVENTMVNIDNKLPRTIKGKDISIEEADKVIENTISEIVQPLSTDKEEFKEKKEKELRDKAYKIELVSYPANIFFETEYLLGNIIIKLNINHPFYSKVILPLCYIEDHDNLDEEFLNKKSQFKDAIILLLLSYSKVEAMYDGNEEIFDNIKSQWGIILATATKELFK